MKLFIPDRIQRQINNLPPGTVCLGSYSDDFGVATITQITLPNEGRKTNARHILAVIGERCENLSRLPVCWDKNDGWLDMNGNPAEVTIYEEEDFFKRTPFDPMIMSHLRNERVLIVGVGSVGAPMGLELAKSGVGAIIAVDKDILEIHNCMRHVLGAAYIGWPKPIAFTHYLAEHVPACECIPVYGDIFEGDRARLHQVIEDTRPTRILAVTDSLRIQYLCQRAALYFQMPLMAVWCDNNAIEGEIFLWEPGQAKAWKPGRPERGCYGCMRDPDKATITRSRSFDYSSDDPDSYGGEPALGTFINRINNIATIVMTAWMLRDCPVTTKLAGILDQYYEGKGLQYIRLGGPYSFEAEGQITAKSPWAVEWYRVLRRPDCSFCSDHNGNEQVLFPAVSVGQNRHDNWDNFEGMWPKRTS